MDDCLQAPVSNQTPTPAAILDPATLAELCDPTVPGLFAELTTLFTEDAPRTVAELRTAIQASDAAEVARLAHALKGSSATLGASAMSATCAALEAAGRASRVEEFGPRLATLEQ